MVVDETIGLFKFKSARFLTGFGEQPNMLILEVDKDSTTAVKQILNELNKDKLYIAEIKKYLKKRSRTANSYYWELVEKLSAATNVSKEEMHEILLQSYGTFLFIGDEILSFKTTAKVDCVEAEIHCKCIGHRWENGKQIFYYKVIKGSRQYNSEEMHKLIEGTISECKQLDIVTLPPAELARLKYKEEK